VAEICNSGKPLSVRDDMVRSAIHRTVENAKVRGRMKLPKCHSKIEVNSLRGTRRGWLNVQNLNSLPAEPIPCGLPSLETSLRHDGAQSVNH
jgi:hypothetical protein